VVIAIAGGRQTIVGSLPDQVTALVQAKPTTTALVCPRLTWRRVRHADYYNVQVYRGRRKILSAWPANAHLQMRPSWRFRGKRFRLSPGSYHWYAWPGFGNRRAHRYGRVITHKRFTMKAVR
jgi:hypothetical protein